MQGGSIYPKTGRDPLREIVQISGRHLEVITNEVNKDVLWLQVLVADKASFCAVIERMNNLSGNAYEVRSFVRDLPQSRRGVVASRFRERREWDPIHQFNFEEPLDGGMGGISRAHYLARAVRASDVYAFPLWDIESLTPWIAFATMYRGVWLGPGSKVKMLECGVVISRRERAVL